MKVFSICANFSDRSIADSATLQLGYELNGEQSAPYKNLRVLRPFVVRRSFLESHVVCQELVNSLVEFVRLLSHRKVTRVVQLQVLRAGYGPMDLHFILRR